MRDNQYEHRVQIFLPAFARMRFVFCLLQMIHRVNEKVQSGANLPIRCVIVYRCENKIQEVDSLIVSQWL